MQSLTCFTLVRSLLSLAASLVGHLRESEERKQRGGH